MSRVVVTGAEGLLGSALVAALRAAGETVVALGHGDLDLEESDSLRRISEERPHLVVNAAAWTDVDGCALDPPRAMRVNGDGAGRVAAAGQRVGAFTVQISTNEVFAGEPGVAYGEDDGPGPVNAYGASKLAGELAVAQAAERYLIVRTAWVHSATRGFPARIAAAADRARVEGQPLRIVDDEWGNPTPVTSLARALVEAISLPDGTRPETLHLAGEPAASRWTWALDVLGSSTNGLRVEAIQQSQYSRASTVPPHAVLSTERSRQLGMTPIRWMA